MQPRLLVFSEDTGVAGVNANLRRALIPRLPLEGNQRSRLCSIQLSQTVPPTARNPKTCRRKSARLVSPKLTGAEFASLVSNSDVLSYLAIAFFRAFVPKPETSFVAKQTQGRNVESLRSFRATKFPRDTMIVNDGTQGNAGNLHG